jgi:hypothetical protein
MSDFEIRVIAQNNLFKRYADTIARMPKQAPLAFARALNHEGAKAKTQVKRVLVQQTGIQYGKIDKGIDSRSAFPGRLSYQVIARGGETNLADYNARETSKGVSAAPWNNRQVFRGDSPPRGSFILPGSGDVYIRTGSERYSIEPLFGPNLARELVRDESATAWRAVLPSLSARVGHELARMMPR